MASVLNTMELLELILAQVDIQSLLTSAIRVSHLWNEVIQTSPRLQTLLFFRPDLTLAKSEKSQPAASAAAAAAAAAPAPAPAAAAAAAARTNPLLLRHFGALLSNTSPVAQSLASSSSSSSSTQNGGEGPGDVVVPSWHRMLTHQPPATKLGIWRVLTSPLFHQGFEHTTEVLPLGAGLRMGDLAQTLDGLERGTSWTLYLGEEGRKSLEEEKDSLLMRKGRIAERDSLCSMWDTSDVVVKFTRWLP